uniref:Neurofilament light polypeptide isoform X1 n=1 Tax=Elaeis guineensis var. tenera TaxID=51953 RepID=A0A8N4IEI5_ELAGV|nr:neurofilament light polypeptide isoform X1 [Elaeis guineensis]XP_029118858.1 neurofilament light polypeptide isoform X1 [Elaeis guineensis]
MEWYFMILTHPTLGLNHMHPHLIVRMTMMANPRKKLEKEEEEEEEEKEEEVGGGGGGGEGTRDDGKNEGQEEKEEAKKGKKKEKEEEEEEEEEEGKDERKNDDHDHHDLGGSHGGNKDANTEEENKDGGPSSIVKRLKKRVDRKSTLTKMVKDYLVGSKYKRRYKNSTITIDAPSDKNVAVIDAGMAQDSRYECMVARFYANDKYIQKYYFSLVLLSKLSLFLETLFGRRIPQMVLYRLKT